MDNLPVGRVTSALSFARRYRRAELILPARTSTLLLSLVCLILVSGCASVETPASDPLDLLFPYQQAGNLNLNDFREPSGIVFHALRGTLFVVGDEGHIAEFQPDGRPLKETRIRKKDFEGITYDPSSGLLYVVTESKAEIVEVSPEDFRVIREFTIEPVFGERKILNGDKNHVEAISFVPARDHPEGGLFYLANESVGLNGDSESVVFAVEAPLKSGTGEKLDAKISAYFILKVIDLAGLHYDPAGGNLYLISDETNTFFEVTTTGTVLKAYALPGTNQEGITVDGEGILYIAQDSGEIIKFKPHEVN